VPRMAPPGMEHSNVSAVIPTLNGGSFLERCLDALAQAPEVDDILVLDAGSTDGSPERAATREGVRVFARPGTSIQSRLNLGVAEARNGVVLLLNDDAFVDPETPRLLARVIEERPRVAVAGASLRWEDGSPQRSVGRYRTLWNETLTTLPAGRPVFSRLLRPGVPTRKTAGVERVRWHPLCCAAVRRSTFLEVGGFDERYSFYFDDHDFCRRIVEHGSELAIRWDAGAVHVGGATTAARDPVGWFGRYQENRFLYLQKWYPRAWRVYAPVWGARACAHAAAWELRALLRRLRSDAAGEQSARAWARTFWGLLRPARTGRVGT
jgi:N-acetylglucosaminyl-diphospho-decaprenol L-rhamnosyltransferase